ncbi:porin [Chromobacterium sp. IIBBL 290-4]|uniref:porin n=1 Tax=Chromobacterium sp. IIBBL 290-4 TaxID=2953890 RepID=UPI0020B89A77|nr:porin [Chromobacterium sp. IIBBL 290-4]UTH73004.1 porin [Chromobacterium sp. IIBBL 290-4]
MKKTILFAALAAAVPALAQADVTLYGSLRAGVSMTKNSANNYSNTFGVDDFGSRIGFKGSEDLGNGLKAIWQVENGFAMDGVIGSSTASGTLANRQTFVGVEGAFGKLRVGYLDDVLADTEATDNLYGPRRDGMSTNFPLYEQGDLFSYGDARFKNSIRYDSPDLAGFNATLQYGAGENQAAGKMKQGEQYGVRLAYQNSGFFGAIANATQLNTKAGSNSSTNRLEGGYNANNLYLAASYQWLTTYGDASGLALTPVPATGGNKVENTTWAINAAYSFGNFKPSVVYSQRGNAKIDGVRYDLGAKQWAAALDYTVSKRTLVQVGYGQLKENKDAQAIAKHSQDTSSLAWAMMKHNF